MFSYATHRIACGSFRSSAPTPTVKDTDHPCLLWSLNSPSWRKAFVSSPSCVGIFYLDTTYAVRILSGPAIYVPATSSGNLLIGSDGDSAMEARPISLPVKDIFHKVLTIVPRRDHPAPPAPLIPAFMLGAAYPSDEWPRLPRADLTPPSTPTPATLTTSPPAAATATPTPHRSTRARGATSKRSSRSAGLLSPPATTTPARATPRPTTRTPAPLPRDLPSPIPTTTPTPTDTRIATAIQHAFTGHVSLALIPVAFPLIPGHPVIEGPISTPAVARSLIAYHPSLAYYVGAAKFFRRNPAIIHLESPLPYPPSTHPPNFDPTKNWLPP